MHDELFEPMRSALATLPELKLDRAKVAFERRGEHGWHYSELHLEANQEGVDCGVSVTWALRDSNLHSTVKVEASIIVESEEDPVATIEIRGAGSAVDFSGSGHVDDIEWLKRLHNLVSGVVRQGGAA